LPRQPMRPTRKQRTREHILADLSANHVEKIALGCGYAVDRIWHDYGLDLALFTFDQHGYLESGVVWIQVKASDRLEVTRDGRAALVRLERKDLLAWIADVYPVIVVVYDAARDTAYWLSIQNHFAGDQGFRQLKGKTVTVRVPTANVLNPSAIHEFARQKAAVLTRRGEPS
jgi:hypothetical protein